MASPNIKGTLTGSVLENSGDVVTGQLTVNDYGLGRTWEIFGGDGVYGQASINSAGVWSYDLDDTNAFVKALDAGETLTDTFVVRAWNLFGDTSQTITITITGAPCFTAGTLIDTELGPRDCAELKAGDLIWTQDDGLQPVRWVGRRGVTAADMAADDKLRPVRIRAGALGAGLPLRDLLVSRQHRMLVSAEVAQQVCGAREVLVAAIRLVGLPGIVLEETGLGVEYIHLLFDRHQIVLAEGAPSESLLLGPEAMRMLPEAARVEIERLFPDAQGRQVLAIPARMIPERRWQKSLVARSDLAGLLARGIGSGIGRRRLRRFGAQEGAFV